MLNAEPGIIRKVRDAKPLPGNMFTRERELIEQIRMWYLPEESGTPLTAAGLDSICKKYCSEFYVDPDTINRDRISSISQGIMAGRPDPLRVASNIERADEEWRQSPSGKFCAFVMAAWIAFADILVRDFDLKWMIADGSVMVAQESGRFGVLVFTIVDHKEIGRTENIWQVTYERVKSAISSSPPKPVIPDRNVFLIEREANNILDQMEANRQTAQAWFDSMMEAVGKAEEGHEPFNPPTHIDYQEVGTIHQNLMNQLQALLGELAPWATLTPGEVRLAQERIDKRFRDLMGRWPGAS